MSFSYPRRFSECWQFLTEYPGTLEQQRVVRETYALTWGTLKHKFFKRLDHSINTTYQRSFLTFGFLPDDMFPPNMLAVAGVTGINMRAGIALSALPGLAMHELGHIPDKHWLTWEQKLWYMEQKGIDPNLNTWNQNVQEMWADSVKDCVLGVPGALDLWSLLI